MASLVTEKLDAYEKLDKCDVNLHLQHFMFQTSTVPAIDFLLTNSWCLTRKEHFDVIFEAIQKWYAAKFLGAATGQGLQLDPISGLITQAQLEKPAGASGGGLGLPNYVALFHRRVTNDSCVDGSAPQFPWLIQWQAALHDALTEGQFQPEEKFEPKHPNDRIQLAHLCIHWWHKYVQEKLYPINGSDAATNKANEKRRLHHDNVKEWSDTRWLRIAPERYRHTIHSATFKATLAAIAMYAPSFKLPQNCISRTVPKREKSAGPNPTLLTTFSTAVAVWATCSSRDTTA